MGRVRLIENQYDTPVMKNIIYAIKLIWKADKKLMIGYFIHVVASTIMQGYVQNILFLSILLRLITGNTDFKTYALYMLGFLAVFVLGRGLSRLGEWLKESANKNVLKQLNKQILTKASTLDVECYETPEFYDKYQKATLVVTSSYFDFISMNFANLAGSVISALFIVSTILTINPVYLIFLAPIAAVFAIELHKSKIVYNREMEQVTNNRVKAYIQRTCFLKDYSKDMRTSNIFAVMLKRFEAAVEGNVSIIKSYGVILFIYSMVSDLFSEFIPVIGTYAFAGYEFATKGTLTVAGFSIVISAINSIRGATLTITTSITDITQQALYFQNLREFFEYEPRITNGPEELQEFESLEFRNVSFKYPGAEKYSLKNVNFRIDNKETLAVVGVNGAGKSTLVKLMLRFYDPTEGEILYNGKNIKEYNVEDYRYSFATVFQDYKNFAISIYENVMCRECTEEDKENARKALERSGAWSKVSTFEKEGDTVLTREFDENGAGLSGGENQKLSTARLFARDFQVAILDEPSSALDPVAEYKMYENLVSYTEDKTVIYISHRLSSAVLSDRIVVLGNGTVLETGTHAQLMEKGGAYAQMFALQASSYNGGEVQADE